MTFSNLSSPTVDGGWSDWSAWCECSVSCGGGSRSRNRICNNPAPECGGDPCEGDSEETGPCNTEPCMGRLRKSI